LDQGTFERLFKEPPKPTAKAKPKPKADFVLLLINSEEALETNKKQQDEVMKIFQTKEIKYGLVDSSKAENNSQTKRLLAISHKVPYPQIFASDGEGDYLFIGGYQEIEDASEDGSLKGLLGLEEMLDSEETAKIHLGEEINELSEAAHRDKKQVAVDFKALEKFPGAKIWNLNDKERLELWTAIDVGGADVLPVHEMQDFAQHFGKK